MALISLLLIGFLSDDPAPEPSKAPPDEPATQPAEDNETPSAPVAETPAKPSPAIPAAPSAPDDTKSSLPPSSLPGRGVTVVAERVLPLFTVRHDPDISRDEDKIGIGSINRVRTFLDLPRLALDVGLKRLTAGFFIAFGVRERGDDATRFRQRISSPLFGVGGRLGAVVRLGDHAALWPRIGASVISNEVAEPVPVFNSDLAFVVFPVRHVGLSIGPTFDTFYRPKAWHDGTSYHGAAIWRLALDTSLLATF
jgi:hypothetical protein